MGRWPELLPSRLLDPTAAGKEGFVKTTRDTEEMYNAIVKDDVTKLGPVGRAGREMRFRALGKGEEDHGKNTPLQTPLAGVSED